MIKCVIFDVGGVLVRTEDPMPRRQLEDRLGLVRGGAEQLVFNSEMGQAAQRGEITTQALWAWVQKEQDLDDAELVGFQSEFFGGDFLNRPLVDLIRTLHGSVQTAIISNATDNLLHVVTEVYPMADAFDLIVGSAYEKVMKPDPRIFQRTLERLNRQPQEAVFVDDFAHNVAGARAIGMHAIHFTPHTDVAAQLAQFGVQL